MTGSRLELACQTGLVQWPDGDIVAYRPDVSLAGLPCDRTIIVHGFKPSADRWAQRGYRTERSWSGSATASVVQVARSRALTRRLVAQALSATRVGGPVIVDGQKVDGVEPLLRDLRVAFADVEALSKHHGRLAVIQRPGAIPDEISGWLSDEPVSDGWHTALAGFSSDGPDPGSVLLADHFPDAGGQRVLDLGSGWGYLSARLLEQSAPEAIDLLEAEWEALTAARQNVRSAAAQFLWEDAVGWRGDDRYDLVICNPPFHVSRKADTSLGQAFIETAARNLKRPGVLALVANRHLPYERTLLGVFERVDQVADAHGYKVLHATGVRPGRKNQSPRQNRIPSCHSR